MLLPHVPSPRLIDPGAGAAARLFSSPFAVVVVAASLGGLEALAEMLQPIPPDLPVPILVVQHLAQEGHFPEILAKRTRLPVRWASPIQRLSAGVVYLAPPGRHLVIRGPLLAETRPGAKINHVCPAADPLFLSAALRYGARTLAVVLTGRLRDGVTGAKAVRRAGGAVIVQEPASCVAPSMPTETIRHAGVHLALPPSSVGRAIVSLTMMPGASTLLGLQGDRLRKRPA